MTTDAINARIAHNERLAELRRALADARDLAHFSTRFPSVWNDEAERIEENIEELEGEE